MNKSGKVLVYGRFNVLHAGHLRLLSFAKSCGSALLVCIIGSESCLNHPAKASSETIKTLNNLGFIDQVMTHIGTIDDLIDKVRPEIVVKGFEHQFQANPERDIIERNGGRLIFCSGETIQPNPAIIAYEFQEITKKRFLIPDSYIANHSINANSIRNIISQFENIRIMVIGDLIVDNYITCEPLGMSQEDPTIVVSPIDEKKFVGGAGIVAGHARSLGAQVEFVSVSGNDKDRQFSIDRLNDWGVSTHLLVDSHRPTTLKQRYRAKSKTLLRVNYLHERYIDKEIEDKIIDIFNNKCQRLDALIFADFNYGCISPRIQSYITEKCKRQGILIAADSQSSSQIGDISRFHGMTIMTPTEREARIALKNSHDGLIVLADQLSKKCQAENILLTLGEEGLLIYQQSDKFEFNVDTLPALNNSPKDVAGAGDSLLTGSVLTLAAKGSIWEAALIGSVAAAVQVSRIGNVPISRHEIEDAFTYEGDSFCSGVRNTVTAFNK